MIITGLEEKKRKNVIKLHRWRRKLSKNLDQKIRTIRSHQGSGQWLLGYLLVTLASIYSFHSLGLLGSGLTVLRILIGFVLLLFSKFLFFYFLGNIFEIACFCNFPNSMCILLSKSWPIFAALFFIYLLGLPFWRRMGTQGKNSGGIFRNWDSKLTKEKKFTISKFYWLLWPNTYFKGNAFMGSIIVNFRVDVN